MKRFYLTASLLILSACSAHTVVPKIEEAGIAVKTQASEVLRKIPEADRKVVLSVYDYRDLTGQHKSNDNFSEYSRAVTQGGLPILVDSLLKAANGNWFTVIERGGLENLLQERKLIRAMRDQYSLPSGEKIKGVGPLLYAGVLLEGGVTAYETNVLTGGMGARYLGIGASSEYRRDVVTVHLRAVSVQSGEVLLSVDTMKTIYSAGVSANVFKFVAFDKLLEVDAGFAVNEPPQLAVRQAIETAVYAMIMEGKLKGIWSFRDEKAGDAAVAAYVTRRDGLDNSYNQELAMLTPVDAPAEESDIQQESLTSEEIVDVVEEVAEVDSNPVSEDMSESVANEIAIEAIEDDAEAADISSSDNGDIETMAEIEPISDEQIEEIAPAAGNNPNSLDVNDGLGDTDVIEVETELEAEEVEAEINENNSDEVSQKRLSKDDAHLASLSRKAKAWSKYVSGAQIDIRKIVAALPQLKSAHKQLLVLKNNVAGKDDVRARKIGYTLADLERAIKGIEFALANQDRYQMASSD